MPELPEVETVRRGVAEHVVGRRIASVQVLHPRAVRRHSAGAAAFSAHLRGATIRAARRRGKYLWLPFDADDTDAPPGCLVVHLGMSGQLLVGPAAAVDQSHLRARITFDDGDPQLRFVDQRTFGGLLVDRLVPDGGGASDGEREGTVPALVAHIARDPIDPLFDEKAWRRSLRGSRSGIKRVLLDQSTISGVGNIYADEALWRAGINGLRPAASLTGTQAVALLAEIRSVMGDALAAGGTSFDALYVNVNGQSGYFDRSLAVYGRGGQPCRRCGSIISRTPFMNRSSYWCPGCQPPPRLRAMQAGK